MTRGATSATRSSLKWGSSCSSQPGGTADVGVDKRHQRSNDPGKASVSCRARAPVDVESNCRIGDGWLRSVVDDDRPVGNVRRLAERGNDERDVVNGEDRIVGRGYRMQHPSVEETIDER